MTTAELKTIFAAYDRISKERSISLFGEERNTPFTMIDKFLNFLKSQFPFTQILTGLLEPQFRTACVYFPVFLLYISEDVDGGEGGEFG
ncbi:hypothetical protein ACTHUT_22205, partial [Neisseria sp. P0022.S010]